MVQTDDEPLSQAGIGVRAETEQEAGTGESPCFQYDAGWAPQKERWDQDGDAWRNQRPQVWGGTERRHSLNIPVHETLTDDNGKVARLLLNLVSKPENLKPWDRPTSREGARRRTESLCDRPANYALPKHIHKETQDELHAGPTTQITRTKPPKPAGARKLEEGRETAWDWKRPKEQEHWRLCVIHNRLLLP